MDTRELISYCTEQLPDNMKARPWETINHGRAILQTEEQLNAYIADLAGNPNSLCYGFFSDGGDMLALSIGGIKHWCSGTEYMINELCVRSDMQGRGTGTAFLEAIQKELLAMDIHTIYLLTESRVPAFEFYKKRGFVQEEYTVSFYKNF